jgi:hypothetical protein
MRRRRPIRRRVSSRIVTQSIADQIANSQQQVFMRQDFENLGNYEQVGRSLRSLIRQNQLIRIGQGLYAKAQISPLSGKPVPRLGIKELAKEALQRLEVETFPSSYEQKYNDGKTTQVPTGRVIGVRVRIQRRIGYNGKYIKFEHV